MAEPFLAELRIMSFNFAPKGWAMCNGQLLPINQNQALFSLLGTTYGGDGRVNFGLPDLRGRVPVHLGNGHIQGERGGEQAHTLTQSEMPQHNHIMQGRNTTADQNIGGITPSPSQALAQGIVSLPGSQTTPANIYATGNPAGVMALTSISNVGGSQAHLNMQPFLVLTFCIALQGIFPSPN